MNIKTKESYSIITFFVSMILLISISFFLGSFRYSRESFSSLCVSDEEFNNLISNKSESSIPLLQELVFDSNPIFFDQEDNHFYYSLVEGSNTAYNPTIEWNSLRYNLAIKKTSITPDSIHNNETIELLIYNNNTYSKAKLTCTTLPLMNINVSDVIYDETIEGDYVKHKMSLQLFDNREEASQRTYIYDGKIKIRGGFSLNFPKKGYKFSVSKNEIEKSKFNDYSLLDLRNSNDYLLYAAYNDQERIRNVFSSNLWYESCANNNQFGITNGMKYEYLELFMNGHYWGLYALGFPIDDYQLNIDMDSSSKDFVYKKMEFNIPESEYDFINGYNNGYVVRTNKIIEDEWKILDDYYHTLLFEEDKDELLNLVDIGNSIDTYLFFNLIQNLDDACSVKGDKQWLLNLYIVSKDTKDGNKILNIPWDLDRTWGNGFDDTVNYDVSSDFNVEIEYNVIYKLIKQNDLNTIAMVKNRYKELRNTKWSNITLIKQLEKYSSEIFDSGSYLREMKRWQEGTYQDSSLKLDIFKEYVLSRLMYMDEFVNGLGND